MSRYKGNSEACPNCGLIYADFRTGLVYQDVFEMLWAPSDDPDRWRYKRRGTVLGLWHQIKQTEWKRHLDTCTEDESAVEFVIKLAEGY